MKNIDTVWDRITRHGGAEFRTIKGLLFTYEVTGNSLRITRTAGEINRSLSRTNFAKSLDLMPSDGPGALRGRQGASYTWAILMDRRIRSADW